MSRLRDVNTTDVRDAIGLGCRTMSRVFDADAGDAPFFGSQVRPKVGLFFSSAFTDAHVPGRHLNALLNAEGAAGVALDESAVEKHTKAALFSYSGSVALPLNRQERDGPLVNFHPHNVREGFHALYALARYRDSAQARELAERSIEAIFELWRPNTGWDVEALEGRHGLAYNHGGTFISGLARAMGPLVKYYCATDWGRALELAIVLKEKATAECFTEDGAYAAEAFGTHTHSTTCVMSSLAQLADLTGDAPLMDRVRAFYDNGLRKIRDDLGWVIENSGPDAIPDRGEANNTGDIVETALILGRWGRDAYYHDAERIVRGHLLPSQLRDNSFFQDPPNPDGVDGLREVADRHLGAFGFPAPYGHEPLDASRVGFNMDIVGGAVGSLCEVYRETAPRDDAGIRVNLLFDHETDAVKVESPYTGDGLRITAKGPAPLFVRKPPWVSAAEITISGADEPPLTEGDRLFFARPPVNRAITLRFDLPTEEIVLAHRTRNIRVRLHGDAVEAMENFGADLTFFESLE